MFTSLTARNFSGVPHLETSQLMINHPDGLSFSHTKPNAIVGPNGTGKSALLTALSFVTLSNTTGVSVLDDNFTSRRDGKDLWSEAARYGSNPQFLPGLHVDSDFAPALYFRPGHIPGNDRCVATAMMCGYGDEARQYLTLTRDKSNGQQVQALQQQLMAVLTGQADVPGYGFANWSQSTHIAANVDRYSRHTMPWEIEGEILKQRYLSLPETVVPVLLLDEPEQSLDALAELKVWKAIEHADCSKLQIVAATHSLYPILNREKFNIIETVPGYVTAVLACISDFSA